MDILSEENYNKVVGERLYRVMLAAGLEIQGFALLLGLSESHIYSLISGRRQITKTIVKEIGHKLSFDGSKLFRLNQELPRSIEDSPNLNKFKKQYKYNPEYFTDSRSDRRLSFFLEYEIIPSSLFDKPVYVWEVRQILVDMGKDVSSDTISKHLKYLTVKGILKSEKRPIRLRNGDFGTRIVDVFFRLKTDQ